MSMIDVNYHLPNILRQFKNIQSDLISLYKKCPDEEVKLRHQIALEGMNYVRDAISLAADIDEYT